jgi:hypothetical protein
MVRILFLWFAFFNGVERVCGPRLGPLNFCAFGTKTINIICSGRAKMMELLPVCRK